MVNFDLRRTIINCWNSLIFWLDAHGLKLCKAFELIPLFRASFTNISSKQYKKSFFFQRWTNFCSHNPAFRIGFFCDMEKKWENRRLNYNPEQLFFYYFPIDIVCMVFFFYIVRAQLIQLPIELVFHQRILL